ncbi:MAG: HAMP domain-containing histidine kinase, partial [Tolypothrix sp. T3-bin4]|nr:HAMP domain-containing histidine kinase [Tolypothrix sp. T3-bin4]
MQELGLKSAMIVPLLARGRILGALTLIASESGRTYNSFDLSIAEELATRAALAIDNGRLYLVAQRNRANAEAASRLKDEFLATLSHELRTPLNAILGWSQMLLNQTPNSGTTRRALETIVRNTKTQTQIVEDILDVSQIITGKLVLQVAPIDLVAIINTVILSVRPAITAKAINLEVRLDPLGGKVLGDETRLQQIFWNLLSNAVKFTPQNGYILVQLEQVNTEAQITVKDTGIGINTKFLPFVFDRFSQADSSKTRFYGGLGLGLAIARHFTELHG